MHRPGDEDLGARAISEELIAQWLSARLWVALPVIGGIEIVQEPAAEPAGFPDGVELVHFVTAANPGARPLSANENARRHHELIGYLAESSVTHWPAAGYAPAEDWVEYGLALPGYPRALACAVGERFGQLAVYEWSARRLEIVACASGATLAGSSWCARARRAPPALASPPWD